MKRKIENTEDTESVYEWNRLPVDRIQHKKPANTKMRTEIECNKYNKEIEIKTHTESAQGEKGTKPPVT